ncbi:hypothetical protein FH972_018340 [Carpinus fangiana]|uniref:Uncharacterized protein n=1 Tax=Carpinus fangiana TaxID=176857 RepID=A0A5N6RN70_9ROSI|nr:hypothetical protein FH972_018340 [Carpinus fangiana]
MGERNLVLVLLWFLLLWILLVGVTQADHDAGGNSQVFKVKPKSQNSPRKFLGFLPKGKPIPPSGPSKKHNNIGLQSSQRSP